MSNPAVCMPTVFDNYYFDYWYCVIIVATGLVVIGIFTLLNCDPVSLYFLMFNLLLTAGLASDCRLGLRWHFHCRSPISKPRPVLDYSPKTTRGMYFRFYPKKSQNELVWPFLVFLAIWFQNRLLSDYVEF